MTSETWAALLAAGVRWRPGMRVLASADVPGGRQGGRLVLDATHVVWDHHNALAVWREVERGYCLPSLDDPATVGCLLAELRRVSGDPACVTNVTSDRPGRITGWRAYDGNDDFLTEGAAPTEGAAIVAALCAVLGVCGE